MLWRLWMMLGWLDIRQRYRRAVIGPFWITISMGIMIATLGLLYASLLKLRISEFIPYLTAGFSTWFLLSTTISEGTGAFTQAEGMIRDTTLPISVHAYRLIWRNLITFFHNICIMVAVYIYYGLNPGPYALLLFPSLVIVLVNLLSATLFLGVICTRFRDAPPIITNLIQIAFFITPILYRPELLPDNLKIFAKWNPFFYLIEIVRSPLLGFLPDMDTVWIVILITCLNWTVAFMFYRRFRSRVAFWL